MIKQIVLIFLFLGFLSKAQNSLSIQSKSESLYNRSIELLYLEKYQLAQKLFQEYINEFPNELKAIDALYYIALCDLNVDQKLGEIKIKNFVERYPYHPKVNYANFDLGTFYFKIKNYETCIRYLSDINLTMLEETNRLESSFKLAYSYMTTKQFEKAGTVFNRIKSTKNKYTYAANYYLGFINYKSEMYEAALVHLKKASENQAYMPLTPQLIVSVYHKQQKYDTLIAYAQRSLIKIENIKNKDEIYLLLSDSYYQKKEWKQAIDQFEIYFNTQKEGTIPDALKYKYAVALYKTNAFEKGIEVFKKIAEKNDSLGQYSAYYLGLSWMKINKKSFAFNAFNQARKMAFIPEVTTEATIEHAKVGLELAKFDDVIESCKEYLSKHSGKNQENIEINNSLSEAYLHTNNYLTAIAHIEAQKNRTNILNKTYQLVTFYHAIGIFNEDRFEEATIYFLKSLENEIDKETTYLAHYFLAECQSNSKDYEKAIVNYQKVITHSVRVRKEYLARSYLGMGYSYYNLKEYQKALVNFKDYLDEAEKGENKQFLCEGYARLADCYQVIKKLKEAELYYSKAIDYNCSELDYLYFQKAIVLGSLNKITEAKETFNALIRYYPNSPFFFDSYYNFALIDFESTKYAASIPSFSYIIDAGKSPIYIPLSLQKRAIAYNNLKQYEKSIEDYKRIISEYPTHKTASSALAGLQDALAHLGKTNEMDTLIQAYKAINPTDAKLEKIEFDQAKNLYFNQNYQEAVLKLEKFLEQYPETNSSFDAQYFLADSYSKINDFTNAKNNFIKVVGTAKSGFLNRSIVKLAEIEMEDKNYSSATKYYLKLVETASNKKEITNAWNGLMTSYYETKDYDSSTFYANSLLKNGATSIAITNKASLYVAKNALAEQKDNGIDYLLICINQASDIYGAEANYLLAKHLFQQKSYSSSLDLLFSLTKNYSSFQKWVDLSFMLIADNYIEMKEYYQAKATLTSIIEHAKSQSIKQEAKEKLEKLDTL